jgi:peptidylprolyl isomerase
MRAMRKLLLMIAACAALAFAGCGGDDDSTSEATQADGSASVELNEDASKRGKPQVTVPNGPPPKQLEETDLIEGTGREAKRGDTVAVQYVGVGYESGEEFDSSWSRGGELFAFDVGAKEVIPGWDQGLEGMKVGGQRELIVPPELAYGAAGAPPAIGPNETLIFVIDLVEVS